MTSVFKKPKMPAPDPKQTELQERSVKLQEEQLNLEKTREERTTRETTQQERADASRRRRNVTRARGRSLLVSGSERGITDTKSSKLGG